MAALGERMKGLAGSIRDRFGSPGYSSNLLGESLLDLMRKATAKTLEAPDDVANQQVTLKLKSKCIRAPRRGLLR